MPKQPFRPNPEMGARAKAHREALGLSKIEVAHRLDVGTTRLSQMEQDGTSTIDLAVRWASAIEMDVQELMFGVKPKKARKA